MQDYPNKCRLCLNYAPKAAINLFRDNEEGFSYSRLVFDLMNFELVEIPRWPFKSCHSCMRMLDEMRKFHELIQQSHDKIQAEADSAAANKVRVFKVKERIPNQQQPAVPVDECHWEEVTLEEELDLMMDTDDQESITCYDDDDEEDEDEDAYLIQSKDAKEEDRIDPEKPESSPLVFKEEDQKPRETPEQPKTRTLRSSFAAGKLSIVFINTLVTPEDAPLEDKMQEMGIFKCRSCDEFPGTYTSLKIHVKDKHDLRNYSICCNLTFIAGKKELFEHIASHLEGGKAKEAFTGEECGLSCSDLETFKRQHEEIHNKEKSVVLSALCDLCGLPFNSQELLAAHLKEDHQDEANGE